MAVLVEFPTEKPYYPLKPTSVYGSKTIPITIYINGLWEPDNIWREIQQKIEVKHKTDGQPPEVSGSVKLEGSFHEYTIISLSAPSKYLKEDLYLREAKDAQLIAAIGKCAPLIGIFITLVIFALSGLATWGALSRKKEELKKYLIAGLSSILTPLATIFVLHRLKLSGRHSIPVFEKWWQNMLFYALVGYLLLVSSVAIMVFFLIPAMFSPYTPWLIMLAFLISIVGGISILAAAGAIPLWFMHKHWKHSPGGSLVHLLLILFFNAVFYGLAWILLT